MRRSGPPGLLSPILYSQRLRLARGAPLSLSLLSFAWLLRCLSPGGRCSETASACRRPYPPRTATMGTRDPSPLLVPPSHASAHTQAARFARTAVQRRACVFMCARACARVCLCARRYDNIWLHADAIRAGGAFEGTKPVAAVVCFDREMFTDDDRACCDRKPHTAPPLPRVRSTTCATHRQARKQTNKWAPIDAQRIDCEPRAYEHAPTRPGRTMGVLARGPAL